MQYVIYCNKTTEAFLEKDRKAGESISMCAARILREYAEARTEREIKFNAQGLPIAIRYSDDQGIAPISPAGNPVVPMYERGE